MLLKREWLDTNLSYIYILTRASCLFISLSNSQNNKPLTCHVTYAIQTIVYDSNNVTAPLSKYTLKRNVDTANHS